MQRHELEIHELHNRPHHVVGLQAFPVALLQFCLWVAAFHDSHTREEQEHVCGRENELVSRNARQDRPIVTLQLNLLQEFVPLRSCWSEDTSSI